MHNKFIQIVASDRGLMALDGDGDVWVYMGKDLGWSVLNMDRLTDKETKAIWKSRRLRDMDDDDRDWA